jgi:hypothetical protein
MKLKSVFKPSIIVVAFLCLALFSKAQGPGDPGPDPDPAVPLDGGLTMLVAAGIGYAAKKRYDKRKNEKTAEHLQK